MRKNKVYALYKGEECLGIGTQHELAEQFKISIKTIYFYTTPTYKKRVKKGSKRRVMVRVE